MKNSSLIHSVNISWISVMCNIHNIENTTITKRYKNPCPHGAYNSPVINDTRKYKFNTSSNDKNTKWAFLIEQNEEQRTLAPPRLSRSTAHKRESMRWVWLLSCHSAVSAPPTCVQRKKKACFWPQGDNIYINELTCVKSHVVNSQVQCELYILLCIWHTLFIHLSRDTEVIVEKSMFNHFLFSIFTQIVLC